MSDEERTYQPSEWIPEVPFDSAEWGLRPPPTYEDEADLPDGTDSADDEPDQPDSESTIR